MIGKVAGRIDYIAEDHALIDVKGIGYLVYCSERTLRSLPRAGEAVAQRRQQGDFLRLNTIREKPSVQVLDPLACEPPRKVPLPRPLDSSKKVPTRRFAAGCKAVPEDSGATGGFIPYGLRAIHPPARSLRNSREELRRKTNQPS